MRILVRCTLAVFLVCLAAMPAAADCNRMVACPPPLQVTTRIIAGKSVTVCAGECPAAEACVRYYEGEYRRCEEAGRACCAPAYSSIIVLCYRRHGCMS